MEYRISQFIKWFSLFLAGWFSLLSGDEVWSSVAATDFVLEKDSRLYYYKNSPRMDYFLLTEGGKKFEVSEYVYDNALPGDTLLLELTPLFSQIKNYELHATKTGRMIHGGWGNTLREIEFYTSLAVVFLSLLAAFAVNRFEYRATLFFFAVIIGATRWWIIGI